MLSAVVEDTKQYEFCMCNPPFFADHTEAQAVQKTRNYSRSDPKSVCTGSFTEMIVEGGEEKFVLKMIEESTKLKDQIRYFILHIYM